MPHGFSRGACALLTGLYFFDRHVSAFEGHELVAVAHRAAQDLRVGVELSSAVEASGDAWDLLDDKLCLLELSAVDDGLPAVIHVPRQDARELADLKRHLAHLGQLLLGDDFPDHAQERITKSEFVHLTS